MKFVFAALIGLQLGLVQSHPTALNGVGPEPFVSTDNIPKLNYSKASPAFYTCLKPGMIALTYNEAPSHNFKDLLDILNSNDVQATFFISAHHLNDITKEPYNSLLQQAFKDGHLIGSNTYNHKDLEKLSLNEQWQELKRNDNAISNLIGVRPVYVRPPYGSGLKNQTLQAILGSWGYKMTWANVDTHDSQNEAVIESAMSDIVTYENQFSKGSPEKNSFVVLNHGYVDTSVFATTQYLIHRGFQLGYKFVTLAECFGEDIKSAYQQ